MKDLKKLGFQVSSVNGQIYFLTVGVGLTLIEYSIMHQQAKIGGRHILPGCNTVEKLSTLISMF